MIVAEDSRYEITCENRSGLLCQGLYELTLQFLHLQTKLASPLLPLISFVSYAVHLSVTGEEKEDKRDRLNSQIDSRQHSCHASLCKTYTGP